MTDPDSPATLADLYAVLSGLPVGFRCPHADPPPDGTRCLVWLAHGVERGPVVYAHPSGWRLPPLMGYVPWDIKGWKLTPPPAPPRPPS